MDLEKAHDRTDWEEVWNALKVHGAEQTDKQIYIKKDR